MGYTLRSGHTTGRVDNELGSFPIRGGTLECDDYETASSLVARYGHLSWPDGDPGEPAASDETSVDTAPDADGEHDDVDLESLEYSALQDLAKARDIPANQSTEDLIAALSED